MTKHLTLRNIIRAASAFLAFVGFIFMFFNQVEVTAQGKINFVDSFFGNHGSPLAFVGYILLIAASLTTVGMIFLTVVEEKKRYVYLILAAVLVVASIFVFIEGAIITSNINLDGITARLLFAPAFAGILAIISALGLCFAEFITDKQLG